MKMITKCEQKSQKYQTKIQNTEKGFIPQMGYWKGNTFEWFGRSFFVVCQMATFSKWS